MNKCVVICTSLNFLIAVFIFVIKQVKTELDKHKLHENIPLNYYNRRN